MHRGGDNPETEWRPETRPITDHLNLVIIISGF